MPTTSLITKCQDVLRNDISTESFAGASLTVTDPYGRIQYESVGGGFPLVVVAATSSEECRRRQLLREYGGASLRGA